MTQSPDRSRILIQFVVGGCIVLALALAAFRVADLTAGVTPSIRHPVYLLPALAAQLIAIVCAVTLWRRSLWLVGGETIGFKQALVHTSILLVGKYLPGKVWGVVGRGAHAATLNLDVNNVYRASIFEQAAVLGSGGLLVVGCLYWRQWPWIAPLVVVGVIVLCVSQRRVDTLARAFEGRWLSRIVDAFSESPVKLCSGGFVAMIGLGMSQWIATSSILLLLVLSLSGQSSVSLVIASIGAVPAAIIAGFIAFFVPAGLGVRESVVTLMLGSVIGMELAFVASVLLRVWSTARDLILGSWALSSFRTIP